MPRFRTPAQIQRDIDEVTGKVTGLKTQMDALSLKLEDPDYEPSAGMIERSNRISTGVDNASRELRELRGELREAISREDRLEVVRSKAQDSRNTEDGDGAKPTRQSPAFIARHQVKDPWGVNGDYYPTEGAELKRHALAAVEQVTEDHDHEIDRAKYIKMLEDSESAGAAKVAQWALASSDPLYRSAFKKLMRNPINGMHTLDHDEMRAFVRADEVARTALSLASGGAGSYLVPFTLDPTVIITNAGIADPIRSIANVKQIATDDWNGVTSAGVTAEWLGEGVEAADASPTFTQPTITPKKASAWVFGSYEVLADSGFANELARLLADGKARLEGAAFATGNTGATRPRGIVAAVAAVTASIVSSATTNAFVAGDVYRVADALRPRDAANASWIANKRIYSLIRQMDTSGGSAFWANMGMRLPSNLLGQPQYETSTMSSVVTTGGNVLLAGNFDQYVIVDRVGMSIIYEPMVKSTGSGRPTGQAGFFAFWRVGADVTDVDAFRLLQLQNVVAATALA